MLGFDNLLVLKSNDILKMSLKEVALNNWVSDLIIDTVDNKKGYYKRNNETMTNLNRIE